MGREHRTYHLVAKITSFTMRDSKRMLQIFYMKNRKITFFNVIQLQIYKYILKYVL